MTDFERHCPTDYKCRSLTRKVLPLHLSFWNIELGAIVHFVGEKKHRCKEKLERP